MGDGTSELTLLLLRIGFLALLWVFVFAIVYALRSDLFGSRVRRMPEGQGPQVQQFPQSPVGGAATVTERISQQQSAPRAPSTPVPTGGGRATRLVITSGPKQGLEIDLPGEQLTIGRSSESGLVIRDDYTSTHHARLMLWNDEWVVQDLDSTNGTFLQGKRVTVPTKIPFNSPVTIGTTSFELRR